MTAQRNVYMEVIDNVISNMRQTFLDDGTDEQVLQDLKTVRSPPCPRLAPCPRQPWRLPQIAPQ